MEATEDWPGDKSVPKEKMGRRMKLVDYAYY
jgi:hypothetical protein